MALLLITADRAHDVLPSAAEATAAPAAAAPPLTANTEAAWGNPLDDLFGAALPQAAASTAGAMVTPEVPASPQAPAQHPPAVAAAVAARLFDRPSHLLRPAPALARDFLVGLSRRAAAAGG